MLRDALTGREVTDLTEEGREDLDRVLSRLSRPQIQAMENQINLWADETGNTERDYIVSNWQTGSDWSVYAGGVFEPLYEACEDYHADPVQYAGWMLGWLVRRVIIARPDEWVMFKHPEAGTAECPRNMWGTDYWRAHRVPAS